MSANSTVPSTTPSSTPPTTLISTSESSVPPPTTTSEPSSTPTVFTSSVTASSAPPTSIIDTSIFTTSETKGLPPVTSVVTRTSYASASETPGGQEVSSTSSATSSSTSGTSLQSDGAGVGATKGLSAGGKTAIAVVVPVVVVALLVLAGIYLWRRRKQQKNSEEARRKELEDYGYNPNNDPALPAVGGGVASSEMMEDASGYRGWGNMTNPSNRKTSTTVSGGVTAVSDSGSQGGYRSPGSPIHGTSSDAGNSGDPLMSNRRETMDSDGIGALGAAPVAGANRTDIRRGPSNASSSYSVGNRSDTSEGPMPVGSPQDYYQDNAYYQTGPYDNQYGGGGQQPIIRDVSARRNTRIESPSVFPPQGNTGIAQNF